MILLLNAKLTFFVVGYLATGHSHTENQIYSSVRRSSAMPGLTLIGRGRDLGILGAGIRAVAVTRALNVPESAILDVLNNGTQPQGLLKIGG